MRKANLGGYIVPDKGTNKDAQNEKGIFIGIACINIKKL